MSAAFAPSNHPHPRAEADEPHHELPPPSSQLHDGPFAHQLSPPSTAYASSPPQNPPRPPRALRQQPPNGVMASANGNGQPMPVPGGRVNGHGNGAHLREMGFAGPRSPPNNKSRHWQTPEPAPAADAHRHLPRPLQVLSPGCVPGWKGLSVSALRRAGYGACALQVLHQGKSPFT